MKQKISKCLELNLNISSNEHSLVPDDEDVPHILVAFHYIDQDGRIINPRGTKRFPQRITLFGERVIRETSVEKSVE